MEKIEAVVFDMDGILLDTESICDKTWEMAFKTMGVNSPVDIVNECRGMNKEDSILTLRKILGSDFDLHDKDTARNFFNQLRQKFIDWNYSVWNSDKFKAAEKDIADFYTNAKGTVRDEVAAMLKDGE